METGASLDAHVQRYVFRSCDPIHDCYTPYTQYNKVMLELIVGRARLNQDWRSLLTLQEGWFILTIWCTMYLEVISIHIYRSTDTTSHQRRCNIMTLHRRWFDVVYTSSSRKHAYIILTSLNPTFIWGCSNEYPQSMFSAEIWKISEFFIWIVSVFGGEIFYIFE